MRTAFGMLTVMDGFTRKCLAIHVAKSPKHDAALVRLTDIFIRL
jgi:hypothetical protein